MHVWLPHTGNEGKNFPETVMAIHGLVSAFDPSKKDWIRYEEHLHYYFVANYVTDGAKKHLMVLHILTYNS